MKFTTFKTALLVIGAATTIWCCSPSETPKPNHLAEIIVSEDEKTNKVIAKLVQAYGGDRFLNMESIRIQDKGLHGSGAEGYTAEFSEFNVEHWDFKIDLTGLKASLEHFAHETSETFHSRTFSTDEGIMTIQYLDEKYSLESGDFFEQFGAKLRTSDTLLAWLLIHHGSDIKLLGRQSYAGKQEDTLRFEMPGSSLPITLYIDAKTGWINRMQRGNDRTTLTYIFGNHSEINGIAFATFFQLFSNDSLRDAVLDRRLTLNADFEHDFRFDPGIEDPENFVKRDKALLEKISDDTYLVGKGSGYSVIIDAGDYLISADGLQGLSERLELFRTETGSTKPLKYHLVTSHWDYMLRDIGDAYDEGATLVLADSQRTMVEKAIGKPIMADRIKTIDGHMRLGPVEIYSVNTAIAQDYGLMYIPSAKAIYQSFHYISLYEDDYWVPGGAAVTLQESVEALGLDVRRVISGTSPKIEQWSDFTDAVHHYQSRDVCFSNREICKWAEN